MLINLNFFSQEEEAEREKLKERRVAEYQERKSKSECAPTDVGGGRVSQCCLDNHSRDGSGNIVHKQVWIPLQCHTQPSLHTVSSCSRYLGNCSYLYRDGYV